MFLTSRKPEYAYKFLVYACKLNAEQELNKSLNDMEREIPISHSKNF